MKFIVAVISLVALQASASMLDNIRGIFQPLELTVERLVSEVSSELQETIDCTVMAVENVFSLGGMFATNPEYERRCKGLMKDYVTPQDTQQTDTGEEKARGNENTAKSVIKNETDRVLVISKMIRQELDNLSAETKKEYNIHDIDLEHVSIQQILGDIRALYKLQQSNRSSSQGNEIHQLFDNILEILRVHKTNGQVYSDDDEVKEIFKNLEKQENSTLIDSDTKKNIVHKVNELKKVMSNIPKTLQDIAKKRLGQESTNGTRGSNSSEITNSLIKTTVVKIQHVDDREIFQNTASQIKKKEEDKSKPVNTDQIMTSTKEAAKMVSQSANKQEKYYVLTSVRTRVDDKDTEKEHHNVDDTKSSEYTTSQMMEESKTVDTTEEQKQIYVSNIIQKSNYNVFDETNSVHSITNEILKDTKLVDSDQLVRSTEDIINISLSTKDQEDNVRLNKESQSEASKPSVLLHTFISQNDVPAAPLIPPPSIISAYTTITEKPDYFNTQKNTDEISVFDSDQTLFEQWGKPDYVNTQKDTDEISVFDSDQTLYEQWGKPDYVNTQKDTDEISVFDSDQSLYEQWFNTADVSDTREKDNDAVKDAMSIFGQSRIANAFFNNVDIKDGLNVFDNPELL